VCHYTKQEQGFSARISQEWCVNGWLEKWHISESNNKNTEKLLFAWTTIIGLVPVGFSEKVEIDLLLPL